MGYGSSSVCVFVSRCAIFFVMVTVQLFLLWALRYRGLFSRMLTRAQRVRESTLSIPVGLSSLPCDMVEVVAMSARICREWLSCMAH